LQILEDTGKILVLPVLCTSIVVPVTRPAASYYPFYVIKFFGDFRYVVGIYLLMVEFDPLIKMASMRVRNIFGIDT
jgi:hypothetical protein